MWETCRKILCFLVKNQNIYCYPDQIVPQKLLNRKILKLRDSFISQEDEIFYACEFEDEEELIWLNEGEIDLPNLTNSEAFKKTRLNCDLESYENTNCHSNKNKHMPKSKTRGIIISAFNCDIT